MSIVCIINHYAASHMPQLIDCEMSTAHINLNKSLSHFNMPRNFQELSNTELMQEIETLHKWMNGKGISSMEAG